MAFGLDIDEVFSFHPATPETGPIHDQIREICRSTAKDLDILMPECPEATLAIRKLQETMMFANAAVAIHGPGPGFDNVT